MWVVSIYRKPWLYFTYSDKLNRACIIGQTDLGDSPTECQWHVPTTVLCPW